MTLCLTAAPWQPVPVSTVLQQSPHCSSLGNKMSQGSAQRDFWAGSHYSHVFPEGRHIGKVRFSRLDRPLCCNSFLMFIYWTTHPLFGYLFILGGFCILQNILRNVSLVFPRYLLLRHKLVALLADKLPQRRLEGETHCFA